MSRFDNRTGHRQRPKEIVDVEYISVAVARQMPGLRLALSMGSPGPWGLSARAIFSARGVPFVAVRQEPGGDNDELLAWTGRRNAPVAIYEDEPAVDGWLEIAVLAERLGSGPSLFPDDPVDRALSTGFSTEICGRSGFGWSRRLMMIGPPRPSEKGGPTLAQRRYGALTDNLGEAPARVIKIMQGLSRQLHSQRTKGSVYLVGDRLSACDLHWACFSLLIKRLSPEACPLTASLPDLSTTMPENMQAAIDPVLIEHRDQIWERHIGLPLDV